MSPWLGKLSLIVVKIKKKKNVLVGKLSKSVKILLILYLRRFHETTTWVYSTPNTHRLGLTTFKKALKITYPYS